MSEINQIIQVSISRQTASPSVESFNGLLIAAEFLKSTSPTPWGSTERVRSYSTLSAVLADGFTSTSFVYRAAASVFAQSTSLNTVYVGRKLTSTDGTETWPTALSAMALYNTNWYGVVCSARDLANQELIATWVEANKKLCVLASSDSNIISTAANSTNVDTVTLSGVLVTSNVITSIINGTTITNTFATDSPTTIAAHISAINASAPLIALGIVASAIGSGIGYVLTSQTTITATCTVTLGASQATATYATVSTPLDIASYCQTNSLTRTGVFYDPYAGNVTYEDCMDAAMLGYAFAFQPGSLNFAFKTLANVTAYTLSDAQYAFAAGKNANVYTTVAGVNITYDGEVGSGDYFDTTYGIDWLTANIQNKVFSNLVNTGKVPFTDTGVQQIVNPLKSALDDGVAINFLASYTVSAPLVANVSSTNIGNRFLPNVSFTGILAGAINGVQIVGTVTL
jgi:hypothetical protein